MKLLLWLYPRRWRDRYGEEFLALLEEQRLTPLDILNVLMSALRLRLGGQPSSPEVHFGKRRTRSKALRGGLIPAPLLAVLLVIGYLTTRHPASRFSSPAASPTVQSVSQPAEIEWMQIGAPGHQWRVIGTYSCSLPGLPRAPVRPGHIYTWQLDLRSCSPESGSHGAVFHR